MKKIPNLSAYLECSCSTTSTVPTLKSLLRMLGEMGYNEFYLGLTDAYKIPEYPYFNYKRGSYSREELLDIEAYGKSVGVTVIPAIQVLGHLDYIWRHGCFQDFMDTRNILEVGNPKAYEFVDAMLRSISSSFKGRRIHVGMDETFGIGTGNYLKHNPPKDKKALVLEYLKKVVELASKYGLEIEIWGDMLLEREGTTVTPEMVKAELPENTLVWQWDYQVKEKSGIRQKIRDMKKHADRMGYAGSAWKIASYAPHNSYSIERLVPQINTCAEEGVTDFMVTLWGDNGMPCSTFAVLPALYVAAECNNGNDVSKSGLDKEKFRRITGAKYDDLCSLDYMNNPFHHKQKYLVSEAFLLLFSDLLIGNFDMLVSPGARKKYLSLARKYGKVDAGELTYVFREMAALAEVDAYKCDLGVKLRDAYLRKDKEAIRSLVSKDLTVLIRKMRKFVTVFNEFALKEWKVLGLECNQLFHYGALGRLEFEKQRLLDYVENGTPLDEIGDGNLVPSYVPPVSEDAYLLNWHQWLFSYCMH